MIQQINNINPFAILQSSGITELFVHCVSKREAGRLNHSQKALLSGGATRSKIWYLLTRPKVQLKKKKAFSSFFFSFRHWKWHLDGKFFVYRLSSRSQRDVRDSGMSDLLQRCYFTRRTRKTPGLQRKLFDSAIILSWTHFLGDAAWGGAQATGTVKNNNGQITPHIPEVSDS